MMVLRSWFAGMLGALASGPAWAQEGWQAAKEQPGGFGYWNRQQEDSVKAVFAREEHLTHEFGSFYRMRNQQWVLVHYRFGIPEGERHIFMYTACPPIDRATFQELPGSYWQDKRGVYYAALSNFSSRITPVRLADLASFHSLGFEHLAIDSNRVYCRGVALPGVVPAALRLYAPGGNLTEGWDFNSSAYLISGSVGYNPDGERLTAAQARHFRPPAGYGLAYPVPVRQPAGHSAAAPKPGMAGSKQK